MRKNRFTRRDFLNLAGISSAGLALSSCGAQAAGVFTPVPSPTRTAPPLPSTLRGLADFLGIELGNLFENWLSGETKYRDILKSDFNLTMIDWGIFWRVNEPAQGKTDYSILNNQLANLRAWGLEESLILRGQPLYWPETSPDWLVQGDFTKTQIADMLQAHVRELVTRLKGKIKQWVVINEPYLVDHPAWRPKDVCYQKIGIEYFDLAFQSAREADPSAVLIYNETDNHASAGNTTRQTREIAARLKAKGLIDGVGCQMHLDGANPPNWEDTIATMRSYELPVYVTELDVDLTSVHGSMEERYAKQAEIYGDVVAACMDSGVCRSITFLGIVDKYSWLEVFQGRPHADACLYDDDIRPKPAYFAVKEGLEKYAAEGVGRAT